MRDGGRGFSPDEHLVVVTSPKRVWIDLDNTPHVPFFAPVVEALQRDGVKVAITIRDAYQTRAVADLFGLSYSCIGRHYGKNTAVKVGGTLYRSLQLAVAMRGAGVQLAVSHGSRSQVIAARMLGVPSLALDDYEFSGRHMLEPTWIMVPAVIPKNAFGRQAPRVRGYDGIKEDVYVPRFKPDSSLVARLGLSPAAVIVLLRPPATEAHYRNSDSNALFSATVDLLGATANVQVVLVPRNERQATAIRDDWPQLLTSGKFLLLRQAEDGLNLIWHSDLVISGGGTMNREAAAMGVPVYSIFRGKLGAVDRYLAREGRLVLLEHSEDVRSKVRLVKRAKGAQQTGTERPALRQILSAIHELLELSNV